MDLTVGSGMGENFCMAALSDGARVLVSGGTGFLGSHVTAILRTQFSVTAFDVKNPENRSDVIEGSVTDRAVIEAAMVGMDGLVVSHMAPRAPGVYDHPEIPFVINVQGTAMLFEAALRAGVRRVVLVSSVGAVQRAVKDGGPLNENIPACPDSLYGLSKSLQEQTARYYHEMHGMEVAVLRPAYVSLGDTLIDKYGRQRPSVNWQFIDPRDIGRAILGGLTADTMAYEVFYLFAGPGAEKRMDWDRTVRRLHWKPEYRFTEFPED